MLVEWLALNIVEQFFVPCMGEWGLQYSDAGVPIIQQLLIELRL